MGLEPIVRAVEEHLRTNLPAKVAEVNAFWGDEPQIAAPADDSYFPGGFTVLRYPSIEFAAPDFDLLSLPIGSVGADLETTLAMRAWVEDARTEPGRLYFRALRTAQAILRTMFMRDAFGPGYQLARERPVRGAYRFNPETGDREEVVGAVILVFSLEGYEVAI